MAMGAPLHVEGRLGSDLGVDGDDVSSLML
jgi:hypothetical protein